MRSDKEIALARWLARHHGTMTVDAALRLGFCRRDLRALVAQGRLSRAHPGVYVEAPARMAPGVTASAAALAAAGPASALSHRSAAWVWGILDRPPDRVELTVPYGANARLQGVTVHRTRSPLLTRFHSGLRLTEPVGTIVDLAARAPAILTSAVDKALAARLVRFGDLAGAVEPGVGRRRRGVPALRAHLRAQGYLGAPTPSVLEGLMTRIFVRFALPLPRAEHVAGPAGEYRLDFAYPELKLAIEVDGYAWHADPARVATDHARRNRLRAEGWQILVYTWPQLRDDPESVASEILSAYRCLAS